MPNTMVNDDLVTKFMTTMRQDQSGNTYSPHTQFKDIMSVSNTMKVEGTLMDDDLGLFEQQAFGEVSSYGQNTYSPPVVQRRSTPINHNVQPQYYSPQRMNPMPQQQIPTGANSHMPSEIMESLKNNPIDQAVFNHSLAPSQTTNYLAENTRMDLFETSVNPVQTVPQSQISTPNISYNSNINETIQPHYQQPSVIKNNNVPTANIDYSFINKIVKDAINEGINSNLGKSNKLSLVKDGKTYNGKISQQKSGKIFFVLDGNDYVIELFMGDIKKIKK